MSWDHVHQKGPRSRSEPLTGYRVLSVDRGMGKDNMICFLAGEELKKTVKRAARKNRRNMSEEIISIITWYYGEFGDGLASGRSGE